MPRFDAMEYRCLESTARQAGFSGRLLVTIVLIATSMAVLSPKVLATSAEDLSRNRSWQARNVGDAANQLRSDLDELGMAPDVVDRAADEFIHLIEALDLDVVEAFVQAAGNVIPVVSEFAEVSPSDLLVVAASLDPSAEGYARLEALPKTTRSTTRLWLGRHLVRQRMFDEALPIIAEVDPTSTIDPASVLFYRGVCYHTLLMKTEALQDLRRLLENESECPERFFRTAQLMIADIKPLQEDSLDEISRMMTDVSRRLDLGRSGKEVESREQQIIDKLSRLIEKAEQQQQQQQQSSGSSQGRGQGDSKSGGSPMQDSRIGGGPLGDGDVDRKRFKNDDAWGNLPPAERHEAIQSIGRDLPTHYREAIEAYFRKLATEVK